MLFCVVVLDEVKTGGTEIVADLTLEPLNLNSEFRFDHNFLFLILSISLSGDFMSPVLVNTKTNLRFEFQSGSGTRR